MRKRAGSREPALFSRGEVESEGYNTLDHISLEFATAANVGDREIVVLLIHPLSLHHHVRSDEPSATELIAVDAHLVRDPGELALRRIVTAGDEYALVCEEAVHDITRILIP